MLTTRTRDHGFTLIELMITVAIVAILAAVALPSYRDSINKSRRAEARAQLTEAAQFMQRYYAQNDSFKQNSAGTAVALPDALVAVPKGAATGARTYNIGFVSTPTDTAFSLQAVPRVGGPMANDKCGKLLLDNVGRRNVADNASGTTVEACWS